ncbi:MAG: heme biosynthesis protein HemY [Legionellales bacterium RIFCSPHIGHO2_12_FULL_35_11]|nr:MAG: heme biosynthesis protein HemY [Legionellales bacterium RIFCSPHIGHO2_12_FULL_35_11]
MSIVEKHVADNSPVVQFTEVARKRVLSYLSANNLSGLRISVKKTGCSGLSYVLDYIDERNSSDLTEELQDDFFISVDKKSLSFLKGVIIDYEKQGINHKFTFKNPNQTGQCGCGESFTVES